MGLITKEVEAGINSSNLIHYQNLGYEIPEFTNKSGKSYVKWGTKIKVKTSDLLPNSEVRVNVQCDCCNKNYDLTYGAYTRQNHEGKIYCQNCAPKVLNSGENHWNWKSYKTREERINERNYPEYKDFVKSVMARDKYICQCCGKSATDVHHLFGYAGFPEYRTDQTQALAICSACHDSFHKWHRENFGVKNKGYCTRSDYEKWLGDALVKLKKYDGELLASSEIICLDTKEIKTANEFMIDLGDIYHGGIYGCCNKKLRSHKGKHFLYYSEYKDMTEEDLERYWDWCNELKKQRTVICITTNQIFDSALSAAKYFNHENWHGRILKVCKGNNFSAGKLQDGTPLQWMFYKDYLNKIENGEEIVFNANTHNKKVICITTGKIFNAIKDGALYYNIQSKSTISGVCNGKHNFCGKLADGTPLVWMYYEDFLKIPVEEQQKILGRNKESLINDSFIM